MQVLRVLAGAALLASISLAPAFARDHGKPVVGGPSHGKASPAIAGQSKSKGPLASPSGAGPKTNGSQSTKAHGGGKPTTSTTKTTTTKTTSTTASGTTLPPTTTPPATTPVSPIATKISSKPALLAKVKPMLPANMSLNDAASGFKNQGQFIAALHVSRNLGVSFEELKSHMVTKQTTAAGTTMQQTGSLGRAIQAVKHSSSPEATKAATRGEREANEDVNEANHVEREDNDDQGRTKKPGSIGTQPPTQQPPIQPRPIQQPPIQQPPTQQPPTQTK